MVNERVFEGLICNFDVKLILNPQEMVIVLWNQWRKRCYQAKIPYQFTGKGKEVQKVFRNLDEFYAYMVAYSEDKDRVFINENGRVEITFQIKKVKSKEHPKIYIETEVLSAGPQMRQERMLHNEVTEIKRDNLKLQERINDVVKSNQEVKKWIVELRGILDKGERRYDQASDSDSDEGQQRRNKNKKRAKKYSVISGRSQGIEQIKNIVKETVGELKVIEKHMGKDGKTHGKELVKEVKPVIRKPEYDSFYGNRMIITVDPNNRYLEKDFKIEGNKITKVRKYNRLQLLSREVVPNTGRHYFDMFIEHISYKIFSFGIASQSRRGHANSHESPDVITYFAKTGAIWEKNPHMLGERGDCRGGGPKIPNGVLIRTVVDMDSYILKWYMEGEEIASTEIWEHLRPHNLVAFLEINYEGDVVYWNGKDE